MTNFPWLTLLTPLMSSRYFHNDPCCGCGALRKENGESRERRRSGPATWCALQLWCALAGCWDDDSEAWNGWKPLKTNLLNHVEPLCAPNIYIIIINYICIKWSQRIEQICKQDRWELVGGSSLKQRLVRSVCPWMERFSRGGRTFAIV